MEMLLRVEFPNVALTCSTYMLCLNTWLHMYLNMIMLLCVPCLNLVMNHDKEPHLFLSSINRANHILMKHYVMNIKLYHYMQKHHVKALPLDLYLKI